MRHDEPMDTDWARLGKELAAARERVGLTQEQVAAQLGIGKSTLQAIEGGTPRKKVTPTIRAYARLVGWTDDSAGLVLAGRDAVLDEQPQEAAAGEPPATETTAPDLSLRVQHALKEGPLIDEQVLHVPSPSGEIVATIVVRGTPGWSPEQLYAALEAWSARRPTLRRLEEADGE